MYNSVRRVYFFFILLFTIINQNSRVMLMPFFFAQFSDVLGYENGSIGAATITVIVVHVIIGLYIWVAIQEEQRPKPLKKD